MNVLMNENFEKGQEVNSLYKGPIRELLDTIDFVKVEVDTVVSSSLMHTVNNILYSISLNLSMLDIEFNIHKMQSEIQNGINQDYGFLVGQIIYNYKGDKDLRDNKYFKNILKSIELIEQNLYFNDKEKFSKRLFNITDIEKYIYDIVYSIEHDKKISKELIIDNLYYIEFSSESYLGNTFNVEPIIINLIADLVHNSIKYSNEGKEVKVSIVQTYDNIIISVLDNGYGIKKEDLYKIFEHGVRLDNVLDEKGNGKGGYDCAYIVKKLGGEIYAKSIEGEGTEIKIIMPN